AHEGDVHRLEGQLETEIAHQRSNHAVAARAVFAAVGGNDVEQLVAVHLFALVIHEDNPVAVAIEGDAHVRPFLEHPLAKTLGGGGAALVIDVHSIRLNTHGDHFRPQLAEYVRRDVIGGTVGAVEHDLQTLKAEA